MICVATRVVDVDAIGKCLQHGAVLNRAAAARQPHAGIGMMNLHPLNQPAHAFHVDAVGGVHSPGSAVAINAQILHRATVKRQLRGHD